jgi:2,3-bisphosphoglycerate-dependent phosphoglycerate mutase
VATTIVLVRHGETDWNRERRFQGHADVPLNADGRRQVGELAEQLAGQPFAAAYTSPLRRAAESAAILAARLGVTVHASEALREIDVGAWSGLTVEEVQARFPEGWAKWVDWRSAGWEDGETYDELSRRVVAGLLEMGTMHPHATVLAVTHGGPIRCATAAALGLPLREVRDLIGPVGNCRVVRIAVREGVVEAVD